MTKLEAALAEIRAVFANEIECLYETDAHKLSGSRIVIFGRQIRLALKDGRTCESTINYAIHTDGYWEQVGLAVNCNYTEATAEVAVVATKTVGRSRTHLTTDSREATRVGSQAEATQLGEEFCHEHYGLGRGASVNEAEVEPGRWVAEIVLAGCEGGDFLFVVSTR